MCNNLEVYQPRRHLAGNVVLHSVLVNWMLFLACLKGRCVERVLLFLLFSVTVYIIEALSTKGHVYVVFF